MSDWQPYSIAAYLNRLPFVRWDRMIDAPVHPDERSVAVYGWIDRPDGRADFVLLTFVSWDDQVYYATSSSEYSLRIHEILYGDDEEHYDCQRVEDVLGDQVRNKVTL